jgi:hypothetical protein
LSFLQQTLFTVSLPVSGRVDMNQLRATNRSLLDGRGRRRPPGGNDILPSEPHAWNPL